MILNIPLTDSTIKSVPKVCNLMQYYVVKEATSLVELALWKSKIEQASGLDRDACRIGLPEPAKDLILKYAYTIPMYTTTNYQGHVQVNRVVDELVAWLDEGSLQIGLSNLVLKVGH